jgi:hypothetical protein
LPYPERGELRAGEETDVMITTPAVSDVRSDEEVLADDAAPDSGITRCQVSAGARLEPRARLLEVLTAGRSGELIVVAGDDVARIHAEAGRIAWVHRPRHRPSLRVILELAPVKVDDATVHAIVERSYATRRHFASVAVELGIKTEIEARASLARHLSRELGAVLGWTDADATFIEERCPSSVSFAFEVAELIADVHVEAAPLDVDLPDLSRANLQPDDGRFEALLDRIAAVPDITGCAVLDMRLRAKLGSRGTLRGESDIAWGLASGFVAMGAGADEMLACRQGAAYLVRRAGADPTSVTVVQYDPTAMLPGMARLLVSDAASS